VREPRVFLMDEPLSNLDAKLREILRAELKDLQMKLGATFLYVTHDQVEAMSMADRVAVLNAGHIVQAGTPQQIYNRPRDTFVAAFVGSPSMNLLPARVAEGRAVMVPGKLELPLDGRLPAGRLGAGLTVGVRSEDVRVGPGQPVEARVHGVENHGVEQVATLRVDECLIKATVPATLPLRIDASVGFSFNPEKVHWFDPSGVNLLYDDTERKNG